MYPSTRMLTHARVPHISSHIHILRIWHAHRLPERYAIVPLVSSCYFFLFSPVQHYSCTVRRTRHTFYSCTVQLYSCLYLRAVVLTLTFCRKWDLSLWRWMNKCQSPVAQQSTRFLHCVTGSARKDNSTFGIVWNLCQIATWKYYGWAHIFF